METSYCDIRFWVSYILFIIIIGGILVQFINITRLASNEIISPSNKIHREVGRAKDLPAPLYLSQVYSCYPVGGRVHGYISTRSVFYINTFFAYMLLGLVFNTWNSVRYAYMFVTLCVTCYEMDVSVTLKDILQFIPCRKLCYSNDNCSWVYYYVLVANWLFVCLGTYDFVCRVYAYVCLRVCNTCDCHTHGGTGCYRFMRDLSVSFRINVSDTTFCLNCALVVYLIINTSCIINVELF